MFKTRECNYMHQNIISKMCVCVISKFYHPPCMSNMTYETKNESFLHNVELINDSQCSIILLINVAIENANCECERTCVGSGLN